MSGVSLDPRDFRGLDLFPDVSEEVDRRIQHSEQRIKTWILGGIAAILLVAIMAAIPIIFYTGQISRDVNSALVKVAEQQNELAIRGKWMQERMIWEARLETQLAEKGIKVPRNSEVVP